MIALRLTKVEDESEVTFTAARESCDTDNEGKLLSFFAYAGDNDEGEPLYVAYVLSDDRSGSKKLAIRASIDTAITGWKTRQGYVKGANMTGALRKGPAAMRAQALRGARSGFLYGLLYVAAKEIAVHVVRKSLQRQQYYISHDGPDLFGPIYLET